MHPSMPDLRHCTQIIGVAASVIGDMSSRPHWGLYELDFVFSTLVVSLIRMAKAPAASVGSDIHVS